MKKSIAFVLFAFCILGLNLFVNAQKFAPLDKSPVDISYFPHTASQEGKAPVIKVIYSRPAKNGREIFGKLEPFDKVWRAGANEQTEIRFYKTVTIGGTSIPAGIYSLFVIPEKDSWTFIINKQTDHWGAYSYDQSLDVARAKVALTKPVSTIENFSITFTEGGNLVAGWDNALAELPIKF